MQASNGPSMLTSITFPSEGITCADSISMVLFVGMALGNILISDIHSIQYVFPLFLQAENGSSNFHTFYAVNFLF